MAAQGLSDKIKDNIEVMHGDIAQNQREVTLKRFKELKFKVLVATDVAVRGIDIPNVDLVVQVEPPKDTEMDCLGSSLNGQQFSN